MDSYKTFESHLKNKLIPVFNSEKQDMIHFCEKGSSVHDYWFLTSSAIRDFVNQEMNSMEISDCKDIVRSVKEIPDDSWIRECYEGDERLARLAKQALSTYSTIYLIEMSYPALREHELKLSQELLYSDTVKHKTDMESQLIEKEKLFVSGVGYKALNAVQNFIDVENMNEQESNFVISEKLKRIRFAMNEKIDYSFSR